jgi:hypothetical protein
MWTSRSQSLSFLADFSCNEAKVVSLFVGILYDPEPFQKQDHSKVLRRGTFFGYNALGFKDESWRTL